MENKLTRIIKIDLFSVSIQIPSLNCKKIFMVIVMSNVLNISGLFITLLISFYTSISCADGNEGKIIKDWHESKNPGVSAVKFQQYNETCGSCHFPYQPGLLPAISWEKIMTDTDNHFGQTLKLSTVESRTMSRYLLDNAAGRVNDEISNDILQSFSYDPLVIRITETPYFVSRHRQLEANGQCDSCHQGAALGKY